MLSHDPVNRLKTHKSTASSVTSYDDLDASLSRVNYPAHVVLLHLTFRHFLDQPLDKQFLHTIGNLQS